MALVGEELVSWCGMVMTLVVILTVVMPEWLLLEMIRGLVIEVVLTMATVVMLLMVVVVKMILVVMVKEMGEMETLLLMEVVADRGGQVC